MGIGPVFAIPMALKNCGLTLDDVDLFEVSISPVFFIFFLYCVQIINAVDQRGIRLSVCVYQEDTWITQVCPGVSARMAISFLLMYAYLLFLAKR
jgi:hypothetical protein